MEIQSAQHASKEDRDKTVGMTPKNPAAVALGRKGGKAYAKNTSAEDRKKRAEDAAEARWAKTRALVEEIKERSKTLEAKATKKAKAAK
jgi:hypothetical protein